MIILNDKILNDKILNAILKNHALQYKISQNSENLLKN